MTVLQECWTFLQKCELVLHGNATQHDADHLLTMFGSRCGLSKVFEGELGRLETADIFEPTIWWSGETKRFYLGVYCDFDGSVST